ncbi:hypothetical protein, partial [Rhizobium sp. M10]|uniref:hypothetical protein n=1 Tax=Rhizobium sp. M10 TaxID=1324586 RepID=UPI001AECCB07
MDGDPASFSSRQVQSFLLLKWLEKSFYQFLCQVRKGFLIRFGRPASKMLLHGEKQAHGILSVLETDRRVHCTSAGWHCSGRKGLGAKPHGRKTDRGQNLGSRFWPRFEQGNIRESGDVPCQRAARPERVQGVDEMGDIGVG